MQKQNFEKEVRKKMEELSFTPSEPVWQKIEASLEKKRDSRRMLLWLLPFLFAVGGGAWWGMHHTLSSNPALRTSIVKRENLAPEKTLAPNSQPIPSTENNQVVVTDPNLATAKKGQQDSQKPFAPSPSNLLTDAVTKSSAKKHSNEVSGFLSSHENDLITSNKTIHTTAKKSNVPGTDHQVSQTEKLPVTDEASPVFGNQTGRNEKVDTLSRFKSGIIDSITAVPVKTVALPQVRRRHAKNWEWNIDAAGGFSGVSAQAFTFNSNKSFSRGYLDAIATPNPNYSNSAGSYYLPALQKNGASFSVGFHVRRKVYRKLSLTAGLQYSYYSSHSYVGQKVVDTIYLANPSTNAGGNSFLLADNLITYYKSDGWLTNYRNTYHFIELPIGLEYSLLKKAPLRLQAGVTITQLIKSNTLQYNSLLNAYYKESNMEYKTGLGLFTSLAYRVWQNKKLSLFAGPQLQYGLSSLQKNDGGRQHPFLMGLKTNIAFK